MTVAKLKFYGVPNGPTVVPFPSGEVIRFPSNITRQAQLKFAGRLVGKSLIRAIPYVGLALTVWEIYDIYKKIKIMPSGWNLTCTIAAACGIPPRTQTTRQFTYSNATAQCINHCNTINFSMVPFGSPVPAGHNHFITGNHYIPLPERWASIESWFRASGSEVPSFGHPQQPLPDGLEVPYPAPMTSPNFLPNIWPSPEYWPEIDPRVAPEAFVKTRPDTGPRTRPRSRPRSRPRPRTLPAPHWVFETPPSGPVPNPRARPRPSPKPEPEPDRATTPWPDFTTSPGRPNPSRPKPGEKEAPKLNTVYTAVQILDLVSETAEIVDCMYNALGSVKKKQAAAMKYSAAINKFWEDYRAAVKSFEIWTPREKAIFLMKKPVWNPAWKSPLSDAKKLRKRSFGDHNKQFGINFADIKAQYIYDNFHELGVPELREAVECSAMDQQIDKLIAAGAPLSVIKKSRQVAKTYKRSRL